MASIGNWSFSPIVSAFPTTVFPNVALWNISNGAKDLEYQVQVSWPLEWTSREVANRYVLDGNALGMTATEAWRRRRPVEPTQPDSIIVSIGYPLTDAVYSSQRGIDFQPPAPDHPPPPPADGSSPPSGSDDFIQFIDQVLRPFVQSTLFPSVTFKRDALYGHSYGGLFVIYALITHPELFDTFFSASPALFWNDRYTLNQTSRLETASLNGTKPALVVSYGSLEQFLVRRRTETEEAFEARKALIQSFGINMSDNCRALYEHLRNSSKLRYVGLKEYDGQDHSSVAASAINDGVDFFVDW